MRVWPARMAWLQAGASVVVGLLAAVAAALPAGLGAVLGGAIGLAVAVFYFLVVMRRHLRRLGIARQPFPEAWRERLESCVPFYRKLDEAARGRFERDVLIFMAEQRIYGVRGAPVPDDAKVLVAASAAMLGHGMPDWEWPTQRDVVIYPASFSEDYDVGEGEHILGMVHAQGPILFSGPELSHGFCRERDGHNVGIHEMAHVLDMADGAADGVPAGIAWVATAPWVQTVADRLRGMRSGRHRRVMRAYAGKNEAELFAVAVETFFETPDRLASRDPDLFEMLSDYFNLDPRTGKTLRPL